MKLSLERIEHTAQHLDRWYAALPEPKQKCFTCEELTSQLHLPMNTLHTALLASGWDRGEVWGIAVGKRYKRVLYAPPGHRVPRPPRGRPVFHLTDYINFSI